MNFCRIFCKNHDFKIASICQFLCFVLSKYTYMRTLFDLRILYLSLCSVCHCIICQTYIVLVYTYVYNCVSCDTSQHTVTFNPNSQTQKYTCWDNIDVSYSNKNYCSIFDNKSQINSVAPWISLQDYQTTYDIIQNGNIHDWFTTQQLSIDIKQQKWHKMKQKLAKFSKKCLAGKSAKYAVINQHVKSDNINQNLLKCHEKYIKHVTNILDYIGLVMNFDQNPQIDMINEEMECLCCNLKYDADILYNISSIGIDIMPIMSHIMNYSDIYHMICPYCIYQVIDTNVECDNINHAMINALEHVNLHKYHWRISWWDFNYETWRYGMLCKRITKNEYFITISDTDLYEAETKTTINLDKMMKYQFFVWAPHLVRMKTYTDNDFVIDENNEHMVGWLDEKSIFDPKTHRVKFQWQIPVIMHNRKYPIDFAQIRNSHQVFEYYQR